jgi:hypothetical protein
MALNNKIAAGGIFFLFGEGLWMFEP